jgi:hypothetical protein
MIHSLCGEVVNRDKPGHGWGLKRAGESFNGFQPRDVQ